MKSLARLTRSIGKSPNEYRWRELTVDLPEDMEVDVRLQLPQGQEIVLQYRLESPSIDICMPEGEDVAVTCWKGIDMEPAPMEPTGIKRQHVRLCGQLVIDLNPEWVGGSDNDD